MINYWKLAVLLLIFCGQYAYSKNLFDGEMYWAIDSTESNGPAYDFEDISVTGSSVTLSDDSIQTVDIGFDFIFYNQLHNTLNISSNGYISFNSTSNGCCSGRAIPGASSIKAGVAAWWEDLNPRSGGSVSYQTVGELPNRYFIVQFTDIPTYSSSGQNTFQYKFFESSGVIEVHYESLYGGGTHTIGIQNHDSSIGVEYFRDVVRGQDTGVPFELPFVISYASSDLSGVKLNSESSVVDLPTYEEASIEFTLYNFTDEVIEFYIDYLSQDVEYSADSYISLEPSLSGFSSVKVKVLFKSNNLLGIYSFPINILAVGNQEREFDLNVTLNFNNATQFTAAQNWDVSGIDVNQDGTAGVFISKEDLARTGKSSSSLDVFYFNVTTDDIQQLTHNPRGEECSEAVISGDALWVAAVCENTLYLFDLNENTSERISLMTRAVVTEGSSIAVNHDGSKLLFLSEYNPLENEAFFSSMDVYSYENSAGTFRKLSNFNAGLDSQSLSMDYSGNNFVVSSRGNQKLGNSDHSYEVFKGDVDHGVTMQLTHSLFDSFQAVISGDGLVVSFVSPRMISVEGDLPSPIQVYKMTSNGGVIEALTESRIYDSHSPSINFDGSKIAFVSHASLGGNNSAANAELFLKDYKQNSLIQLTEINASYDVEQPRVSLDGSSVYFSGKGDWQLSHNPHNLSQIFSVEGLEKRRVYLSSTDDDSSKVVAKINIILPINDDDDDEDGLGSVNPAFLLFLSLFFYRRAGRIFH